MFVKRKHSLFGSWGMLQAMLVILCCTMLSCFSGAADILGDEDNTDNGAQKFLELNVEHDAPTSRLITVNEYPVTSLRIVVNDPAGDILQVINWAPTDGSRSYRIPVQQQGEHSLTVTHTSTQAGARVSYDESTTFNIRSMIITVIDIIPGCVGFINIDGSAQNATRLVRESVVPEILQQTDASRYLVKRMETTVQPGTTVYENAPGSDDTGENGIAVDEESYLFLMDLDPGAYFAHPVKYVLVTKSGMRTTYDANWLPRINEKVPESLVRLDTKSVNLVDSNVVLEKQVVSVKDWVITDIGPLVPLFKEGFLVVQGLTSSESCYTDAVNTYTNGYNFFNAYKGTFSSLVGIQEAGAADIMDKINDMVADNCYTITIYIIAHGNTDLIRLGGVYFYASDFVNIMNAHSSVSFNLLLGSCHSGSFVNDLNSLPNVKVVETSTSTSLNAYPDWDSHGSMTDFNALDIGSEWTSTIIEAAYAIVNNPAVWSIVTSEASTEGVPRTSMLFYHAGRLGVGIDTGLGISPLQDYDLSRRAGYSDPQHHHSW